MAMTIPPQLEAIVREKVATGQYGDADEVIAEALRLLDEHDRARVAALREALAVAEGQIARGEGRLLTPELIAEMDRNVAAKAREGRRPKADVLP